jgi:hypothetical protein
MPGALSQYYKNHRIRIPVLQLALLQRRCRRQRAKRLYAQSSTGTSRNARKLRDNQW